jgi:transcriptional regulator GlxA family with amidase domain
VSALHRVVILALGDAVPFDLAIAQQVFGQASEQLTGNAARPAYEVLVAGCRPLDTPVGQLIPPAGLETLVTASTVIVPGRHIPDAPVEPAVGDALLAAASNGVRLVSICTGAFVLAAAGLLDGRRVATHWKYADLLSQRYPAVTVEASVLYIDDGDILTSAGLAAGIDLCLHIVRRDHGIDAAAQVARVLVVAPHRAGGQAQFIERPLIEPPDIEFGKIAQWMLDHFDQPLMLRDIAQHAACSERTLLRWFRQHFGTTPRQWLLQQRVAGAQRLLETTELSIEQIAAQTGFSTSTNLRRHFSAQLGTSPRAYRTTFRAGRERGPVGAWQRIETLRCER